MSEFEQKRTIKRVLSSPLALIVLAVILFFLARGVWNIYQKDRASSEERLAKLQERQTALESATRKLSTESGIESEIRDRFQMVKTGEREIVIVDDVEKQNQITPAPRNFLQKIWDFFTIR
jgi:cell division protein FtsB